MKLNVTILRNELEEDHKLWIKACEEHKDDIEFRVVNLTSSAWFEDLQKRPFDVLLAKPGGLTTPFKQLYDERIFILSYLWQDKIFPSPIEIYMYENKRFLYTWLKANNIPHPDTRIFYNNQEALFYTEECRLPLVAKTNIGASGSGIKIIRNRLDASNYIKDTFSRRGASRRTGPNLMKGGIIKRGFYYLIHPSEISKKLDIYQIRGGDRQKDFVIFQEYIPHDFEWRTVRIGDSFFAHKKIKLGEKSSGSLLKNYDNPPLDLLNFIRLITDKYGFHSVAIDIFESDRGFLVNEVQCMFGQSDPYQMLMDGKPGRYRYTDNKWLFENGDFAKDACFNLRLEYLISLFKNRNLNYPL